MSKVINGLERGAAIRGQRELGFNRIDEGICNEVSNSPD